MTAPSILNRRAATPGPWEVEDRGDEFAIVAQVAGSGCSVAKTMNVIFLGVDVARANAHLLAAALDLLAAAKILAGLEKFVAGNSQGRTFPSEADCALARAAIARATAQSPDSGGEDERGC